MTLEWVLYLAFGGLAGILSGLFGIGGGVVIVPFLIWWFERQEVAMQFETVMAVATSLATIVITSIAAVLTHCRQAAIDWRTVGRLAPGILVGAVLGSVIAGHLPVAGFKLGFGAFLGQVGISMWRRRQPQTVGNGKCRTMPRAAAGLGIGAVAAILGIGGGSLSVPYLVRTGYDIRQAVAISAACGIPLAVAGTATYVGLGLRQPLLPPGSFGYVYLPAFFGIIFTSVALAPYGARLAYRLPLVVLRRLFALLLLLIGARLLWQGVAAWNIRP